MDKMGPLCIKRAPCVQNGPHMINPIGQKWAPEGPILGIQIYISETRIVRDIGNMPRFRYRQFQPNNLSLSYTTIMFLVAHHTLNLMRYTLVEIK